MYQQKSDIQLINLISKNDEKAFDEIYRRYASKLYLYGFKILKDKFACQEIVQNIFVSIWNRRGDLKIESLSSYLFRSVKFQILNYFRKKKFTDKNLVRLNLIEISYNASVQMEFDELEKKVLALIEQMPNRRREIFILSRFENKSNKEIAELFKISVQGVKNQISHALKYLRFHLQEAELAYF